MLPLVKDFQIKKLIEFIRDHNLTVPDVWPRTIFAENKAEIMAKGTIKPRTIKKEKCS
jgi:hypothetical protein